MDVCIKGKQTEAFYFNGDPGQLKEWLGHGIAIIRKEKYGYILQEVGCIDVDSLTLVGKSGGLGIGAGDLFLHTPEICRDGIRRYEF